MIKQYYNTTELEPEDLAREEAHAKTQEEKILDMFDKLTIRGYENFTPFDVQNLLFKNDGTPITSIRRAMTNLTARGKLVKTDIKRKGSYGKQCYAWRLA